MAIIQDLDLFGKVDDAGNPQELFNDEAIANALKIWLGSANSDYIKFEGGGPLKKINFKRLTIAQQDKISFQLRNSINNNFTPGISVNRVEVVPKYEDRAWEINVFYTIPGSQEPQTVTVLTRDFIADRRRDFQYVDVDFSGDNLVEFVMLKQLDIPNERLIFNIDLNSWVWGPYKLTNFTNQSANFTQILQMINGSL